MATLFLCLPALEVVPNKAWNIFMTILVGIEFDLATACIAFLVPAILFYLLSFFQNSRYFNTFWHSINALALLLFIIVFLMSCADIAFVKNYNTHINVNVFSYAGNTDIEKGMVKYNQPYTVSFSIIAILFSIYFVVFSRKLLRLKALHTSFFSSRQFLYGLVFTALGAVGVFAFPPLLTERNAYFSENGLLNQIAVNPGYSFVRNVYNFWLGNNQFSEKIGENQDILSEALPLMQIPADDSMKALSPIARRVNFQEPLRKMNVVLVLMESMSSNNLSHFGSKLGLTPYLDSLSKNSLFFENFYSAGTHTNNGIYASTCGYPIIPEQHALKHNPEDYYHNLPTILGQSGYKTIYMTSHDPRFDNMNGFLLQNGFQKMYGQSDYPADKVVGVWGVPDHVQFDCATTVLDSIHDTKQPFFATILTTSNHEPYKPQHNVGIKYKTEDEQQQTIQYSDWAIGQFLKKVQTKPWFENTIFVFVADHGYMIAPNYYDMALSYNHIPLFIYAPRILPAQVNTNFGGQIDIPETILGLLHIPHINNSFGVDILRNKRDNIFFQADTKVGAIDSNYFYIFRPNTLEDGLYEYRKNGTVDCKKEHPVQYQALKQKALLMPKLSQWMLMNKKTMLK
jgi:phosphoglycerol transferase MdoB-like AlkP superfamily enzyme